MCLDFSLLILIGKFEYPIIFEVLKLKSSQCKSISQVSSEKNLDL